MNIKFVKIHLHNFASYLDSELDLTDMGVTLVSGRNLCKFDNAYSNGSGKSAIFNGLCFALTGETSQGISTGLENIYTDPDDCWVEVEFIVDSDYFVVRRIKTPKQNMTVYINGENKSGKGIRESAQILANYIPDLTSELLSSIIILGQGMPHRFTNNKPSHRKELLENLTKSDFMIQSIKDKLENRQFELKTNIRSLEDDLIGNKSKMSVYEKQVADITEELSTFDQYAGNLDNEIENTTSIIKTIDDELLLLHTKENEKQTEVNNIQAEQTKLLSVNQSEIDSVSNKFNTQISELECKVYSLKADIRSVNKDISKIESIKDICPTCGQRIPDVDKPSTAPLQEEITRLNSQLDLTTEELKGLKQSRDNEINVIKSSHNKQLQEINYSLKENQDNLQGIRRSISDITRNKQALIEKQFKLINLKNNFDKLQLNLAQAKETTETITEEIQKINIEITKLNQHVEIIQQMITLAKREFRGILLINVINLIDKKVKQYSKEVFGTDRLSFTLNDNYIDITYCDKLYENLSGGEKQKIDIIIQLALRDILSKQLNIHSNLLVLDEIYDNADAVSCQKITNLISTLNDIDSIFIISHHVQDLGITYDNNLLVQKDEQGISNLSFV